MSRKQITFKNSDGQSLSAVIELPVDRKPHNYALFAHCFTCNKNFKAVRQISGALAAEGFGVLSFDFTGLGASEGDFADTNFSSSVDDLVCAAGYLADKGQAPTLIVGHSLGGSAALLAANVLATIRAVVTIGSPSEPSHVRRLFEDGIEEIQNKGEARIDIGGRPFTVKKQFVDDLESQDLKTVVSKMDKSFLFLHSPQDKIVSIENAAALYGAARHPKSFVSLDGADHLLSEPKDALYAGRVIANWASRYVDSDDGKEIATKSQVVAYLGPEEKFTTQIRAGHHQFTADEPLNFGGNDFGPSPYDLVASGLAACSVMTLRMYAERKKWQLDEVYCHVRHEKSHFEDCSNCTDPNAKIDRFTREFEFIGELDDAQEKRLLEIADKCPVHRTLEAEAEIQTSLLVK